MRNHRGFTLLELLLGLGLLTITLALATAPLSRSLHGQSVLADSRELLHLIRLSRQSAINTGTRVVVCTVNERDQCTRDWSQDVLVFSDLDRNNQINGDDRILHHWNQENPTAVRWQGFGPGYLRFRSSGYAVENGAFTVCPGNSDRQLARQLVINRVGRVYMSRDRDGDGVVEYGNDQEPEC